MARVTPTNEQVLAWFDTLSNWGPSATGGAGERMTCLGL
jgi:hypothetical protein